MTLPEFFIFDGCESRSQPRLRAGTSGLSLFHFYLLNSLSKVGCEGAVIPGGVHDVERSKTNACKSKAALISKWLNGSAAHFVRNHNWRFTSPCNRMRLASNRVSSLFGAIWRTTERGRDASAPRKGFSGSIVVGVLGCLELVS